ncbi:MAG: hypothetical protein U1F43_08205 [Myxococcota bacterium]
MPRATSAIAALFGLVASGLVAAQGACGGDDGKTCKATLCDPGEAAVCSGNDVRSCAGDGKRYVYTSCGAQQRCDAASGPAACVPRQCTNLGVASCASPTSVVKCLDDGSATETTECSGGERCNDGVCAPTTCSGNDAICTAHGFLSCQGGVWTSGACGAGQVCSRVNGGATCGAPVCTPGTFRCEGESSRACDARGTVETGTSCGKTEVCVDGRCQAEVCGVDVPDATTTDTSGDTSEPQSEISFKIGTATSIFDQTAIAEFDSGTKTLTLRADRAPRAIRIILENARATATGTFSDTVFSTTKVTICYDDGGAPQTFDRCPDGYTHQSSTYSLDITSNAGVGSRVVGTFATTVNDENGDPTALVDGTFTLNYR